MKKHSGVVAFLLVIVCAAMIAESLFISAGTINQGSDHLSGIAMNMYGFAFDEEMLDLDDDYAPLGEANINRANVVRVGYYELGEYSKGAGEGLEKSGYGYEYLQHIAGYTGWEYEYVYGDFGELIAMLSMGEIDLLYNVTVTPKRKDMMLFPDESMSDETHYLYKLKSNIDVSSMNTETLNDTVIGVTEGTVQINWLDDFIQTNNIQCEVREFASIADKWEALENGEVDTVLEMDTIAPSDWLVVNKIAVSDHYLAVAKGRTDLLIQLNSALSSMSAVEPLFVSELQAKYFSDRMAGRNLSKNEKRWVSEHEYLRVGYLRGDMPYSGAGDGENTADGLVYELMILMCNKLGINPDWLSFVGYDSRVELEQALTSGEIDTAFGLYCDSFYAEENGFVLSAEIVDKTMAAVFRANTKEDITKVIAVSGNNLGPLYVKNNYSDSQVVEYDNRDACITAVLDGEATCAVVQNYVAQNYLDKYSTLSMVILSYGCPLTFAVSKGESRLLILLNRGLALVSDGEINGIVSQNTVSSVEYNTWDFIRDHIQYTVLVVGVLIASLIIAVIAWVHAKIQSKELYSANARLEQTAQLAAQASNAKSMFLSNMSHDIRTPMNAIIGYTRLASENLEDSERVNEYLGKISSSSSHLLSLINDVLDMSRIESGKIELDETPMSLKDMFRDVKTIILGSAEAKHLRFSMDEIDIEHDNVYGDKTRIKQVVINLLSNAIKFTNIGGIVELKFFETEQNDPGKAEYRLSVRDNGIGMSKEFAEHVFDMFEREHTSTVSKLQGSGLGMSITKNIIDLMQGEIICETEQGVGTEFIATFALRICDEELVPDKITENGDTMTKLYSGKKILLVEDNIMNAEIASEILNQYEIETEIAYNGAVAVDAIKENPAGTFDLVLMDIQMPVMNGYEATKEIRSLLDEEKAHIKIVAMTANAFDEDKREAMEYGFDGFIAKPIDVDEMMATIAYVLS